MYQFTEQERAVYERMPIPLAIYQYLDGHTVTLLVSDGFCRMYGVEREALLALLDDSMYATVHPNDTGRLARTGDEFAHHLCEYDVLFRSRRPRDVEYRYIHSVGRWHTMADGTEVAILTYSDLSRSQLNIEQLNADYVQYQTDHFYIDPLTGLPNLNFMHKFAVERVNRLLMYGETPALLYIDVLAMQSYNNLYGYARGDELLVLIADILKDEFQDGLVIRAHDDHFVVIAHYPSEAWLSEYIDNVNHKIKLGAFGNTTGIQVGVCLLERGMSPMDAMSHAKQALKELGYDLSVTYRIYSQAVSQAYWEKRYIIEEFDNAIRNNWIKVYYQAIMRAKTGRFSVLEALARWIDPVRGIISPGEFIPVLEKHNLLYKLDMYMVEQVCREVRDRLAFGLPLIPVSINFSARDFDHVDVVDYLNRTLEKYQVDRDYVIVEITEQDIATATDHFKAQLRTIRENGYKLWIDDFGSGYSNLNVFSQYNIDLIKFDMELLRHLDDNNGANRLIMKAIVNASHRLGVHTLSEGVETQAQLDFLKDIGCELAQGYLLYRPQSHEAIAYKLSHGATCIPCETPEERAMMNREIEG